MSSATPTHAITIPNDDYCIDTPKYVAEAIGVHPYTLQRWRADGTGPPFVQLSMRRVGYQRAVWRAWLRSRTYKSNSEASAVRA